MTLIHLKPIVNGITEEMLTAIDEIKSSSVTRDEHNFWFETNVSQAVIDDLCTELNLEQIV